MRGILLTLLFTLAGAGFTPDYAQNKAPVEMIEEDRAFWNDLLAEASIKNKNLFYAGYVAYREKLTDLSMESFRECVAVNDSNEIAKGVSFYYIGKNFYRKGDYPAAIENFLSVLQYDLAKFNDLKFAAGINIAVSFHRSGNIEKFREHLQKVIAESPNSRYGKAALVLLNAQ